VEPETRLDNGVKALSYFQDLEVRKAKNSLGVLPSHSDVSEHLERKV
jgi:hypothetical protein